MAGRLRSEKYALVPYSHRPTRDDADRLAQQTTACKGFIYLKRKRRRRRRENVAFCRVVGSSVAATAKTQLASFWFRLVKNA